MWTIQEKMQVILNYINAKFLSKMVVIKNVKERTFKNASCFWKTHQNNKGWGHTWGYGWDIKQD